MSSTDQWLAAAVFFALAVGWFVEHRTMAGWRALATGWKKDAIEWERIARKTAGYLAATSDVLADCCSERSELREHMSRCSRVTNVEH